MNKVGAMAAVAAGMMWSLVAALPDATGMFPFVPSYEKGADIVDMSSLLDAPAGAHGRIRVKDGHFVNDRGTVRLHATNLTGPANFPTHAEADRLADRLARFGINCVRLHYFDSSYGNFMLPKEPGIIDETGPSRRKLDPQQRDRQDYLVAAFKKRGIYVNVNLHVARTLGAADGVAPGTPWANKGIDQFDPHIIELEKEYARELLTHVNPYTGLSYLKDPVVAVVELNNEDGFWREWHNGHMARMPEPHAGTLRKLWNNWLTKKYGTGEQLRSAWSMKNVPLGAEQVTEGAFAEDGGVKVDGKRWIAEKGDALFKVESKGGALQVKVTRAGGECFPKLHRRVAVEKGKPYTLSFRIRRASGEKGEVGFAVANRVGGWESLGVLGRFAPGKEWTKKTLTFTAPKTLKSAEVQFTRFKPGVYEIDDLSFREGADFGSAADWEPAKGTVPVVKPYGAGCERQRLDFEDFICDTESEYWVGMQRYLQQELGLEAPVSGTQVGHYSPAKVQGKLDYVDNHAYWLHPAVNKQWTIGNTAMVNAKGGCIASLAARRVEGKPYTISEYNHPYPNFYGAEGQLFLRGYGALLDWDGVFEYSYNNRQNAEPLYNEYFFSLAARTDVLVHFPACAAMYLRGDVKTGADGKFPEFVDGVSVSDTKELVWRSADKDTKGTFTVNTPQVKAFTGFANDNAVDLGGGVALAVGKTKLGWATVSLVSRDATGFGEKGAARILVTATGLCHNGGAKFREAGKGRIGEVVWGKEKTICEGVPATLTLPVAAARVRCWALDEKGERAQALTVAAADGKTQLKLDPQYRTVWYEVEIK